MGARRKGRCQITYAGRRYLWYIKDEWHLRIASEDKRFAVAYQWPGEAGGAMLVSGPEFPGIPPTEKRPVRITPPCFKHKGLKTLVRKIIRWSLREDHEIRRIEKGPFTL